MIFMMIVSNPKFSKDFLFTNISKISISSYASNSLNSSTSLSLKFSKLFSTKGIRIASSSQRPRLHCHKIFFSNSFKIFAYNGVVEDKGLIKLEYLSILELNGKGSFELLQGQITANMEKVSNTNAEIGAICDLKGRVVSSFYITENHNENGYFLIGEKKVMEITKDVLKKYQPFYDTELSLNDSFKFCAVNESDLVDLFSDTVLDQSYQKYNNFLRVHCLDKEFHILGILDSEYLNGTKFLDDKGPWLIDEIQNQNFEIDSLSTGQFTPHELGYHVTPRIDFEKGCYTGQEIVARMHYRAKKLPVLLVKVSQEGAESLTDIKDSDGKKIGKVLLRAEKGKSNYHLLSMSKNYLGQDFDF